MGSTEGVVVRRGWLRTRLEVFWPKPIVHRIVQSLSPGGFALAATANLWLYRAHSRGRCLVFRKGLGVEGVFYQWDQVCLERSEGEAVFMIGKDELRLPAVVLDRHQDWLNTPLRVKWICLRSP